MFIRISAYLGKLTNDMAKNKKNQQQQQQQPHRIALACSRWIIMRCNIIILREIPRYFSYDQLLAIIFFALLYLLYSGLYKSYQSIGKNSLEILFDRIDWLLRQSLRPSTWVFRFIYSCDAFHFCPSDFFFFWSNLPSDMNLFISFIAIDVRTAQIKFNKAKFKSNHFQ